MVIEIDEKCELIQLILEMEFEEETFIQSKINLQNSNIEVK